VETSRGSVEVSRLKETIAGMEKDMLKAADDLRFEEAAAIRDEVKRLRKISLSVGVQ